MQNTHTNQTPWPNWNDIERHFHTHNAPTAVYPIFEGAFWQMAAADTVLAALDEHRAALEWALTSREPNARQQLRRAQTELEDARAAFLDDSQSVDDNPAQTLRDLEVAWQSRLLREPGGTP